MSSLAFSKVLSAGNQRLSPAAGGPLRRLCLSRKCAARIDKNL